MKDSTSVPRFSADDHFYGEDPFDEREWLDQLDPADGEAVDYLLSECPRSSPLGWMRPVQPRANTERRPA